MSTGFCERPKWGGSTIVEGPLLADSRHCLLYLPTHCSEIAKQVVGVQQPVGDLRVLLQAAADRRRDRLTGLAAQAGQFVDVDGDAAHAAHFVMPRGDFQANTQLLVHPPLQAFEVGQALDAFQAFEQALLLGAGQQQDARIAAGAVQQALAPAVAGAGWAGLADRGGRAHGLRS